MSQNGGRAMTKGQRSGKNSRNLRYLNLSFGVESSTKSHGHRPHGGYKGLPNHHPPSILSFNKPPEYLEGVKNDCVVQQEQDKLERGASPQWVHGAACVRNHTGEFPLFTHQYLSSSKLEQLDASGGLHKGSSETGSEIEYFRPNRLHQYLTATEMPYDSKRGVDLKLGRPTRTSLLRARHRSQSAPSLNSSQMDVRHLHTIGQITDSANKPKKQILRRNLLPSTGQESLHQFLTGARYNRVHWIDKNYGSPRSPVLRDNNNLEEEPGYLPPYGSEVSSSNSSTQGDAPPGKEKEKEILPPPVNKPVTPLAKNKINTIHNTEDGTKTSREILPPPGKPIPAWDTGAEKGGSGDNNNSKDVPILNTDTNNVLTPKKVTLIGPEDRLTNSVSQHELKRHVGNEATCVICCNCYAGEGTTEQGGRGGGDADDYHYSHTQRSSKYVMNNMSIKGTRVGLSSPGRPKPAPRRVTFHDKHIPQQSDTEEISRNGHTQGEENPADVKENADENNPESDRRTEKEPENLDTPIPDAIENDPAVSEADETENANGAVLEDTTQNEECLDNDAVAEETGNDAVAEETGNDVVAEETGNDVVAEETGNDADAEETDIGEEGNQDGVEETKQGDAGNDVAKETDAEIQKEDNQITDNDKEEAEDEAGNAEETPLDTARSDEREETYQNNADEAALSDTEQAGGSISVSVTVKDKPNNIEGSDVAENTQDTTDGNNGNDQTEQ